MAWYNKYRPQRFEEVIGQSLVKTVLQNALKTGRLKHAYLFSGPKGTGKTTLARIFANSLNGVIAESGEKKGKEEAKIDIIEMDAASNTGIDDVRQLIESGQTPPLIGQYKIYIIDEVHMLSKAAMNALLKILEEPPQYLIFLLCTTNPEKLIPTVLSRLTKLNLTNHTLPDLVQKMTEITKAEEVEIDLEALNLIARRSNGGQRDAINFLETIASYGLEKYTVIDVAQILGLLPEEMLDKAAKNFLNGGEKSREILERGEKLGLDGETFLSQLLEFLLEKSLQGSKEYDTLILPTVTVLNWRLPLTNLAASFALLQSVLAQANTNFSRNLFKKEEKKTELNLKKTDFQVVNVEVLPESLSNLPKEDFFTGAENFPEIEENYQENKQNLSQNLNQEISKEATYFQQKKIEAELEKEKLAEQKKVESLPNFIEIQPQEQKVEDSQVLIENSVSQSSEVDLKKVKIFIRGLKSSKDSPTIFKLIGQDLALEDLDWTSKILTLSVSNGLFLTKLGDAKTLAWLSQNLKSQLQLDLQIQTKQRDKKESFLHEEPLILEEENPFLGEENFLPNSAKESRESSSKADSKDKKEPKKEETASAANSEEMPKIFYQVYKSLPENMQESGVSVFAGPIPLAPKKLVEEKKDEEADFDWEDAVSDFFAE